MVVSEFEVLIRFNWLYLTLNINNKEEDKPEKIFKAHF